MTPPGDLWALITQLAAAKGARPAIVSYDGDARVELSATALANWVAKTAGWLQEEAGLRPGCRVALLLPPTWTAAVCTLGTWAAGGTPVGMLAGVAAAFVAEEQAADVPAGLPALAVGRGFTARPSATTPLPAFPDEILPMPDDLLDPGAGPAVPAWTDPHGDRDQAAVLAAAAVASAGWAPSDVLLLVDPSGAAAVSGLAAALLAQCTLVLCHGVSDVDAVARAERVTLGWPPAPDEG